MKKGVVLLVLAVVFLILFSVLVYSETGGKFTKKEIKKTIAELKGINKKDISVTNKKFNKLPPEVDLPKERGIDLGIYEVDDGTGRPIYVIGFKDKDPTKY